MSEVAVLIVFAHTRQFAEFVERIWVGDVSYPLPNGHFVELMLPRNFSGPPIASARLARWFISLSSSSQLIFLPLTLFVD